MVARALPEDIGEGAATRPGADPAARRAEMIHAGGHLALSALERLPRGESDYALLRGLLAGPEPNLFLAARAANVTLTPGAWVIIVISLLAGPQPRGGRELRDVARWWLAQGGGGATVLGAAIGLLGCLEAAEAGAASPEEALAVARLAGVLAHAAREAGHAEDAYDLCILGLGFGAPAGEATHAISRLALDIALQRDSGSRVGVCAVEVARACAAMAGADGGGIRAAQAAFDFAAGALPLVTPQFRAPMRARLMATAQQHSFLGAQAARLVAAQSEQSAEAS